MDIYVGRGWNNVNEYNNKSLAICFMGDYVRYAVTYLLAYGVARQYIEKDYKLVAHNQVMNKCFTVNQIFNFNF